MSRTSLKQEANGYRWLAYLTVFTLTVNVACSMSMGFRAATTHPLTWLTLIWFVHHVLAVGLLAFMSTTPSEMRIRLQQRRYAFGQVGPIETLVAHLGTASGFVMNLSSLIVAIVFIAQCTMPHTLLGIMWIAITIICVPIGLLANEN